MIQPTSLIYAAPDGQTRVFLPAAGVNVWCGGQTRVFLPVARLKVWCDGQTGVFLPAAICK